MTRKLSPGNRDLKRAALGVALCCALPCALRGQPAPDARAAQAAFERARIARLPWSMEPAGGPCDEVVGRFCYRRASESDRPPPPEPAGVPALRDSLIAVLDAAAASAPADGWIAGQRVRYLLEAGRVRDAVAVAAACRAEAWWCAPRTGAAPHADGAFVAAERAFDRALAEMPPAERERWSDLAPILDAPARRLWRELEPGARAAFADRAWWVADPLWSVPGNERRSEHFARRVQDRIQAGSASAYGVAWGADLEELLVRYGWPVAWERVRDGVGRLGGGGAPGILAHDPPGARRFLPSLAAIADPAAAEPRDWALEDPAPRATYAPSYALRFLPIEPQLAAFRRASGAVLAVGWSLPADSVSAGATAIAAVFASEGPDRPFLEARSTAEGLRGALALRIPWPRAVVSVEARGGNAAGRWRGGIELPVWGRGLPAVSDLLLLEPGSGLPATLDEAVSRARATAVAASGESLPVFWEAYPARGSSGGPATIALAIRPAPAGLGTRLARAVGLRPGAAGAELRWNEILAPGAVAARAVELALPALPAGEYLLELEIAWPGGAVSRASRAVAIRR